MTEIVPSFFNSLFSDNLDPSNEIAQQQHLMVQLLQLSQQSQQKLAQRQEAQAQEIHELQEAVSKAHSELRKQANSHRLITINQLDTMLDSGWDERDKNRAGTNLANFSRARGVKPTKIPHPVLPNGVNAYEPGIVKAWLEQQDIPIPADLRYVD